MKWLYRIKNKMMVSLLLFMVMGMVFMVNLKEGQDSSELRKAFVSMYDDRLVVEGYILKLTKKLHKFQEILENPNLKEEVKSSDLGLLLQEIARLNRLYKGTVLTEKESETFGQFTELIAKIEVNLSQKKYRAIQDRIPLALVDLESLSEIQLVEAEKIMSRTNKLLHSGSLTSQLELAFLIVVGLMIQVLLFSARPIGPDLRKQMGNLN